MLKDELVIGFIPARGGSKGLPGKNLMKINDRTLIELAADCTLGGFRGKIIDVAVVSSDDSDILDNAADAGCVTHERSPFAATDEATAADVLYDYFGSPEVLIDYQDANPWVVYLQPTSPARTALHVEEALSMLEDQNASALVSVSTPDKSPYWRLHIGATGRLNPLFPEAFNSNRQQLQPAYIPNGAIYIFRLKDFMAARSIPVSGALAYVMPAEESIDIDTQADYDRAKALLER